MSEDRINGVETKNTEVEKAQGMTVEVMRMNEKEYRAYPAVSYSRLSDIEKVGILAVNANVASIGKLRGVVLGSITDDVISNRLSGIPDYVKTVDKIPGSGTITELAIESIVEKLSFTNFMGIDKDKLEHFLGSGGFMKNGMTSANFHGKLANYQEYINALKAADADTQIITRFDLAITKKAILRLKAIYIFSDSFQNSSSRQVVFQRKFLAKVNGVEIKCMLDAIDINHDNKTITPIDIKTGVMTDGDFYSFYNQAYLKYNYYIQAGLYRKILVEFFKNVTKYKDYVVEDFMFIYSSTNPRNGLSIQELFIHSINKKMYLESFKGFTHYYRGDNFIKKGIGELLRFYKDNKTPDAVSATKCEAIA